MMGCTNSLNKGFTGTSSSTINFTNKHDSPEDQGSKISRTWPKGLKVVSDLKFCAESENQRLRDVAKLKKIQTSK